MILAVLAVVTASFQPPAPKVGDLITVTFPAPVVLDASREFEVVSRDGNVFVVRTFEPRPFALSGIIGPAGRDRQAELVRFRNLVVPVRSVLKEKEDLAPAPLAPPQRAAWPELPWIAAAFAALLLLAAWLAWWLRARRTPPAEAIPLLTPEERFRQAVLALRENRSRPLRWATLADETRVYLAATRPRFGTELTTAELLPRLADRERIVEDVLRQGDLEKFSTRGAEQRDFDEVAERVLDVASVDDEPGTTPSTAAEAAP